MKEALHIIRLVLLIGVTSMAAVNAGVAALGIAVNSNLFNMIAWLVFAGLIIWMDGGITRKKVAA